MRAAYAPLFAPITIDGRRPEISLKKKVDQAKWNPDAGFMKGSSGEARVVNQYINQVRTELFEQYQQLLLKGEYTTPRQSVPS